MDFWLSSVDGPSLFGCFCVRGPGRFEVVFGADCAAVGDILAGDHPLHD